VPPAGLLKEWAGRVSDKDIMIYYSKMEKQPQAPILFMKVK